MHQPPRQPTILLLENIHPLAADRLAEAGFRVKRMPSAPSGEALGAALVDVDVLGIRSKTQLPAEVFIQAPQLRAVGCFCIGTNQVDLQAANQRGVPVFNAPLSNTRSVAELVISELIALSRQLWDRCREMHAGHWRKLSAGCFEVRGKTLGIVGYGHIGAQLGVLAEALGMRVIFHDIRTRLPLGNNQPVASLEALLAAADFVSVHVPATPQTANLLGAEALAQMRPGSCLLNLSRGSVVDLTALAERLAQGKLAGAAIDVFPSEPDSNEAAFSHPLQGMPNVVLTPHIGGSTEEAQAAIGIEVVVHLLKFLRQGTTTGAVNFPKVELPMVPGRRRLFNVHQNVPGVLHDINRLVSARDGNIHSQTLATDPGIGALLMDLDPDVVSQVQAGLMQLDTHIRTNLLP